MVVVESFLLDLDPTLICTLGMLAGMFLWGLGLLSLATPGNLKVPSPEKSAGSRNTTLDRASILVSTLADLPWGPADLLGLTFVGSLSFSIMSVKSTLQGNWRSLWWSWGCSWVAGAGVVVVVVLVVVEVA